MEEINTSHVSIRVRKPEASPDQSAELGPQCPIAAFDLDGTLAPDCLPGSSGRARLRWRFAGKVPRRVLEEFARTHRVVVVTNQSNRTNGLAVFEELRALPFADAVVAHGLSGNRKPGVRGWQRYLAAAGRDPAAPLPPGSFYCGDAAGRAGDFACSDRFFAANAGLEFRVPEDPRGEAPAPPPQPCFARYVAAARALQPAPAMMAAAAGAVLQALQQHRVCRPALIMCGAPGSGKTSLGEALAAAFGNVLVVTSERAGNRRWVARAGLRIASKFPRHIDPADVAIADNTHPTRKKRGEVAAAARAAGFTPVILAVATPRWMCEHLQAQRLAAWDEEAVPAFKPVPTVAKNVFWKALEPPTREADQCPVIRVHLDSLRRSANSALLADVRECP